MTLPYCTKLRPAIVIAPAVPPYLVSSTALVKIKFVAILSVWIDSSAILELAVLACTDAFVVISLVYTVPPLVIVTVYVTA